MVYAADKFLRDFLGISSVRNPGILNNKNHEDPTYPIFHIKFHFNPPEAKHPDYVTNRLLSDLRNETDQVNPESAIKYLYNVGEPERAMMLKKFNISLKTVSEETPWFFQSVNGLDSLYKHGYESERGDRGLQEALLTINTLDSIDFRITALKDLYRKVAYDRKFRRWVLPVNMRKFRMSVLVGDYRQLAKTEDNFSINGRQALNALRDIDVFNASNIGGKLLGKVQDGALSFVKRLEWWDNHFSCLVFDCQDCEFDMNIFTDSNNLSHSTIKQQANSFKIKIGRVLETNTYSLLEYSLSDNLIENFLKSENKSEVITRSRNLSHVFKRKVESWSDYQNLEREKGDNKRVILDDGGFSNVVGAGINEAANFLGVGGALGGTNLGSGGGIGGTLGSIVDFAGDTASEIAQEALGLATEQIASNVYGNELTRSIAGVGLGILNGDLNQVAQNFSNPVLAGALGINVESSGRPVQPNLRDGVPSKLDLTAPSVQRSLSDVQANLTGEGPDPRFQSIGRPGQSLFNNPISQNRVFDQKNIDLQAARVETEMPDNVEFSEVRKETRLNPNKEVLTGANVKTRFDESSVNLQGAGKKTDLVPSNADLTGAQPLKDLVPSNADLDGAQPLKDLVPSNADLTGAQPLKDLVPSNADLTGAQPLKDLVPSNADLTGVQPLKDLVPSNADLTGAQPLKDLNPNSANLTGAQALKDLVPNNVELNGAESQKQFNNPTESLIGAGKLSSLNPSNVNFVGASPLQTLNDSSVNLEGASALNTLNETNADLIGAASISTLNSKNIELDEPMVMRTMTQAQEELISPSKKTSFDETNVDFSETPTKRNFDENNVDLVGSPKITSTISNAELVGTQPLNSFSTTNVDLTGTQSNSNPTLGTETLTGREPLRTLSKSNVGDMSVEVSNSQSSLGNENLLGKSPLTKFNQKNVNLIGFTPNSTMQNNIELEGSSKLTKMNKNVNLTGSNPAKLMDENANLQGSSVKKTSSLGSIDLERTNPIRNLTDKNVDLTGQEPSKSIISNVYSGQMNLGIQRNSNLSGQNKIDLKSPNVNNIIIPKNLGLE